MTTNHYWYILFLLCALFILLYFSSLPRKNTVVQEGLADIPPTPSKWFISPFNQAFSSTDLQHIISEIQKNPAVLDIPGTITGIINNPSIMLDPTIAAAIASNPMYMSNSTISQNTSVANAASVNPPINPKANVTPLTSVKLQQQISNIQMTPTVLDNPGMITTILNNPTIMDDPTVAAAIANDPTYSNNTIISVYPSVFGAIANNTINPFNNTEILSSYKIQQQISAIQMTPSQLDIPGQITTILNNKAIMNDPTVTYAIVNDKMYMNTPEIVTYITLVNPNAISNPNTWDDTSNPFRAAAKKLTSFEITAAISNIQSNQMWLDTPGAITVILNNQTIMDDSSVGSFIIQRQTYMHNNFVSTYPAIVSAYNKAILATANDSNPALPVPPLSPENFSNISEIVDQKITPYTIEKIRSDTYNTAYHSNILKSWKSSI